MAPAFDRVDVVREGQDVFREALVVLQGDLDGVAVDLALDVQRPEVDPPLVTVQVFDEGADPTFEVEGVVEIDALVAKQDGEALVEEGELAQPVRDDVPVKAQLLENFGVGPEPDVGAGGIRLTGDLQCSEGGAPAILLRVLLSMAHHGHLQPLGEGIDDREPNPVQTT